MRPLRSRQNRLGGARALWHRLGFGTTGKAKAKEDGAPGPQRDRDYRAYVGPAAQYDFMGAAQFRLLTTLGLREEHYLLDIGCGSLRAGRLLIPYLLPSRYHGIEPNRFLIEEAIANEVGADLIRLKRVRFAHNADFDYAVFSRKFDYIIAQSVFSHTGADLAEHGLSGLPNVMHGQSIALVTFKLAEPGVDPSKESGWIYPATVPYDEARVAAMIWKAGLFGVKLPWFHPRQTWFLLAKNRAQLPSRDELASLSGDVLRDERFTEMQATRRVAETVDAEALKDGKSIEGVPFPPEGIFFKNRDAEESIRQGIANVDFVRASGANIEDGFVLDIGCGYGRFAYGLLNAGFQGRYSGVDIAEARVAWLTENFTKAQPRYNFHFLDVQNNLYNPEGRQTQLSYRNILRGDAPDTIVLFSVFSHMYGDDIERHLGRIAEIMSTHTKLMFSCFLFDGVAEESAGRGNADRRFDHVLSPDCRCQRSDEPLKAIAYSEKFLRRALEKAGLVGEIFRGGWSGQKQASPLPTSQLPGWPGYQDWIVARKI